MVKNINSLIFIINFMIWIVVFFVYVFFDYTLDNLLISCVLFTVLFLVLIFSLRTERYLILKKNLFKHSTLVLLGLLIVNFQKYLDFYFGYIDKNDLLIQVSDSAGAKSLLISLLGLISFFMGFLLKNNSNNLIKKNNFKITGTNFLSILSVVFLFGFLLTVDPLYVFGGYGIHDMGNTAIYFTVLFKSSFFALIIQKVINISQSEIKVKNFWYFIKFVGYLNILIIFPYIFIVLLSGDRGDLIVFSLLMLIGYMSASGRKISLFKSVIILLGAAFIITLLGVARSFNTLENSSFIHNISSALSGESNKIESDSISPFTAELSNSVKALHYSVEYVPSQYDYLYSRFHMQAIFGVIPFSSSVTQFIFNDNSVKYNSSDSYVTWLIEGDDSITGHGTSVIADFYLSYGIFGIVFGMGFLGWLIRYCEQNIQVKNNRYLILLIISFVIFSSSIYLSRSSLLLSIRLVIWIWGLMILNRWLNQKLGK